MIGTSYSSVRIMQPIFTRIPNASPPHSMHLVAKPNSTTTKVPADETAAPWFTVLWHPSLAAKKVQGRCYIYAKLGCIGPMFSLEQLLMKWGAFADTSTALFLILFYVRDLCCYTFTLWTHSSTAGEKNCEGTHCSENWCAMFLGVHHFYSAPSSVTPISERLRVETSTVSSLPIECPIC